ncbi:MAG: hypothetical protein CFE24_07260 [Flavobacterium sp. BFFFF2]|nr:MAG: hypothetical protein CFE24_07260 [Flavobacterium sp. BFFFF2]
MKDTDRLLNEIQQIKRAIVAIENSGIVIGGWISKESAIRFFGYCENQLRHIEKNYDVEVSKIGRRKFYSVESIIKVIKQNQIL